ncbi:uncharacterized protein LOC128737635 [Sabethes cyaneus]|uniref:uncharacterized protein LOC128737635 n=1 Tax=Sabethes cyaneus TaxID=53552 RepID=UPI00237E9B43|nr:uncharacterized protein LOC128737635 [Sabethes cyaneus]
MSKLWAICISLVIVSVLVQNANAKRGCAAFGHACYGGHGKRSSSVPEEGLLYGSANDRLKSGLPPLPYLKMPFLDRARSLDVAPELRPVSIEAGTGIGFRTDDNFDLSEQPSLEEQNRFDRGVRFAMHAILRQLMDENRIATQKRQQPEAGFQSTDAGTQAMNVEQK